jgi:uncharacterized membrane protein YdjX (TVP38/TMEM64 family)
MFSKRPLHLGKLRIAAFLAIIVLSLLFLNSKRFGDAFYSVIFWGEDLINAQPLFGTISFFLLSALSAILAFASTILLIPSAILVWGMPLTFLLLLGGWTAGAILAYWIGSWLARPVLAWLVTEQKLSHYERLVSKETKFWMILLFCLAVPSEIPGFVLGAMRYDFAKFVSAVIIAETAYAVGAVLIAQNILDKEILSTGTIIIGLTILIAAASAIFIRATRRKSP